MARFNERSPQLMDLVDRIDSVPSSTHIRNALAIIARLEDDGRRYWSEDDDRYTKWKEYCGELSHLLRGLRQRRRECDPGLETTLKEFIHEFEHSTHRMRQMAFGIVGDTEPKRDESDERLCIAPSMSEILDWFNLVYRLSTYALISAWADDEQESVKR